MHTLPITCNQVIYILGILITIVGIRLTWFGIVESNSIGFALGLTVLIMVGFFYGIWGLSCLVDWCGNNVRCKCKK